MKQTNNPRLLAMKSLIACEKDGKFSNLEINSVLNSADFSLAPEDKGLYTRLVYGVLERKITLDYIIGSLSNIPCEKLDADVITSIRIGLYQLVYMDRVPDFAAVSESVSMVQRSKRGFVNAVLRSFLRKGKHIPMPQNVPASHLFSIKYSFPKELCQLYIDCYGEECAEGILDSSNREPPIALRVNTLRCSAAECAAELGGRLSAIASGIVLADDFSDKVYAGIESGRFFVQDEASRICTAVLGAEPGETVIDTCACPGGKTFSAALDMENSGCIYAFDLHKNKLPLIDRGAERLGITIIKTAENDAKNPLPELIGKADRVLCDAPCSGLGVIAKKPDIRYKPLDSINRLPKVQYSVLCGASEYVRPGGVLVYSTCTLNTAENEGVVNRFLENSADFALESFGGCMINGAEPDNEAECGMKTFFPHRDGCDGFFIAKLRRILK